MNTDRVATLLRELADELQADAAGKATPAVADAPQTAPAIETPERGNALASAKRLADEITLRNALYRALHRYSPTEPPALA